MAGVENRGWQAEIDLTKRAIEFANKMNPKPRFFIVCGDLVDEFVDKEMRLDQIGDLKQLFSRLDPDIPLVCVCGNHDVGDQPTHESIEVYRKEFGEDYFSFVVSGVLMIVLNSSYFPSRYSDPSLVKGLADEQNTWLNGLLATVGEYKHAIIFQHIPWFTKTFDEEDADFNVFTDVRLPMLEKFSKAGVKAIFCGHYHQNAGGRYKEIDQVVTTAVGFQMAQDKSGLRVVKVTEEGIEHVLHEI